MPRILSLPPELLHMIVKACDHQERCQLRMTCSTFNNLAMPIVFSRLVLFRGRNEVTEHQIITLAVPLSPVCDFVKYMEVNRHLRHIPGTELSWPHFGQCDDLTTHLPAVISRLRYLTRFRLDPPAYVPAWLISALLKAASGLPLLTDLTIWVTICNIPLSIFSNLSRLVVVCRRDRDGTSFFVTELATVIANSPQLRDLDVTYWNYPRHTPLPTLNDIFAKLPSQKPLHLKRLRAWFLDPTVDPTTLPHLTELTSFKFRVRREDVSTLRRSWANMSTLKVRLPHITLGDIITPETISYLLSYSGLRRLYVNYIDVPTTTPEIVQEFRKMLFSDVLPTHANSLKVLKFLGGTCRDWVFDDVASEAIMKCCKLTHLYVCMNGEDEGLPVQHFLDTVSQLPRLKKLVLRSSVRSPPVTFKPREGLYYVEEVE